MRPCPILGSLVTLLLLMGVRAEDGYVNLQAVGTNLYLQVHADEAEEWRFQVSGDLVNWSNAFRMGTVFSGKSDAPWSMPDDLTAPTGFYRAVPTTGLYDTSVVRTISLTFAQTNWPALLTSGRTTGSNVLCTLVLDGRSTHAGVGARYKGNSSFTGMGGTPPAKKSLNLELDYANTNGNLMGYDIINLNNAFTDETIMRESVYFNVMRQYTVCPQASLAKLYINGAYWGVYSLAQQPDGDLIREWFPSNDGDRWRAPNMAGMGGGGGGGGMGGGGSALTYLGTNVALYKRNYELKSGDPTNAWLRLMRATEVLNNTATNLLRDKVEDILAVDRWLWFLAIENIFTDEDSYYFKGADYCFYYEVESGRIHPVEYDGNESFMSQDASINPLQGSTDSNRPLLRRLLGIAELRQRYLAHMRTVLQETFNPPVMWGIIGHFSAMTIADILADPKKGYAMSAYTNDLTALKNFVNNRHRFLTNHVELRAVPPTISTVSQPLPPPSPLEIPIILAEVHPNANDGIDSVWLYHRGKSYGRFTAVPMFDDGAHGDDQANDGIFGAATTNYPAGTKVRYYVEARSATSAKTACFAPARAELVTYSYRVGLTTASNTPVVLNEFQASNSQTLADPQGDYDDWIELHNLTDQAVDLTGHYLTDDPTAPRKWRFPDGTTLPAGGYLLVWADGDDSAAPGLHASFKLAAEGEQILLLDTDEHYNAILDAVSFGGQKTDFSYGRLSQDADTWGEMAPTPGRANH